MRAHYLKHLEVQESYTLKEASLHHLVNVVRLKDGEHLLLLDGQGLLVETVVEGIGKKELRLRLCSHKRVQRSYEFDLAIGIPKREALELCIKQATELGFRKIYLIRSAYSQMRPPEKERTEKLIVSALEQSNAPFMPETLETTWEDLPWNDYASAIMLDSQSPSNKGHESSLASGYHLLVIGPEAGFSEGELHFLHSQEKVKVVNLPTPILRTPTALAAGAGVMIESLLK